MTNPHNNLLVNCKLLHLTKSLKLKKGVLCGNVVMWYASNYQDIWCNLVEVRAELSIENISSAGRQISGPGSSLVRGAVCDQ